jgi:hypothetical protein
MAVLFVCLLMVYIYCFVGMMGGWCVCKVGESGCVYLCWGMYVCMCFYENVGMVERVYLL